MRIKYDRNISKIYKTLLIGLVAFGVLVAMFFMQLLKPIFLVKAEPNFNSEMYVLKNLYGNEDFLNQAQPYLNGNSLKGVFQDGNLISINLNDFSYSPTLDEKTIYANYYANVKYYGLSLYAYQVVDFVNGNKYYSNATAKGILPLSNPVFLWRVQNSDLIGCSFNTLPNPYQYNNVSCITNAISSGSAQVRYQLNLNSADFIEYEFQPAYFINMSYFGISSKTKNEMDTYFELYKIALGWKSGYTPQYINTGSKIYYVSPNVVIDVTEMFGVGNEPTFNVFVNNYLSYAPEEFETWYSWFWRNAEDYLNIRDEIYVDDMGLLEWSKSLVNYYGSNMDFDIFVYNDTWDITVYEIPGLEPFKYVYGTQEYFVNWVLVNEYNSRYFRLNMSTMDELRIKRILFDRRETTGYIQFTSRGNYDFETRYYVALKSKFVSNVNIQSIYMISEVNTEYDPRDDYFWRVGIQFYDNIGVALGGQQYISHLVGYNAYRNRLYVLPNYYTGVGAYIITIDHWLADVNLTPELKIYELAVFADSEIILNPPSNDYFDFAPPYEDVKPTDILGHLRNFVVWLFFSIPFLQPIYHFVSFVLGITSMTWETFSVVITLGTSGITLLGLVVYKFITDKFL